MNEHASSPARGGATAVTVEEVDPLLPRIPSLGDLARYLPGFAWRVVVPVIVILLLAAIPFSEKYSFQLVEVIDILYMMAMAVVFLFYLQWQVKRIHRSGSPETRWVESVIVLGVLFVAVFARGYRILAVRDLSAFNQPLNMLDSYYYTLTVFSTVGFGDIVPKIAITKVLTMAQIVGNLAVLGLVVRVLAAASSHARASRALAAD